GRHALGRSAVGEAVGNDIALSLLLERVVADRLGRTHRFLGVAGLQDRTLAVAGARGPDAGITIGLEFDPDLDRIALGLARARLEFVRLVQRALEVLDVMPDLMSDDIGRGRVSGRSEALRQLVEEARVDVNPGVVRAVEWPGRG